MKPEKMSDQSIENIKPVKLNEDVSLMMMHWSFWARRLYRGHVTPEAEKTDSRELKGG